MRYNFEINAEFERLFRPECDRIVDELCNPYKSPGVPLAETASLEDDLKNATDILRAGDRIGLRVRRSKHCRPPFDWSVRVRNRGYATEIEKIQRGTGKLYLHSYSRDDTAGLLDRAWLIDLGKVLSAQRLRSVRALQVAGQNPDWREANRSALGTVQRS